MCKRCHTKDKPLNFLSNAIIIDPACVTFVKKHLHKQLKTTFIGNNQTLHSAPISTNRQLPPTTTNSTKHQLHFCNTSTLPKFTLLLYSQLLLINSVLSYYLLFVLLLNLGLFVLPRHIAIAQPFRPQDLRTNSIAIFSSYLLMNCCTVGFCTQRELQVVFHYFSSFYFFIYSFS